MEAVPVLISGDIPEGLPSDAPGEASGEAAKLHIGRASGEGGFNGGGDGEIEAHGFLSVVC